MRRALLALLLVGCKINFDPVYDAAPEGGRVEQAEASRVCNTDAVCAVECADADPAVCHADCDGAATCLVTCAGACVVTGCDGVACVVRCADASLASVVDGVASCP